MSKLLTEAAAPLRSTAIGISSFKEIMAGTSSTVNTELTGCRNPSNIRSVGTRSDRTVHDGMRWVDAYRTAEKFDPDGIYVKKWNSS